jgi:HSP20 family protein
MDTNQQNQVNANQQGQAVAQSADGGQRAVTAERRPGVNVGVLRPPVDVIEDAGGIILKADIPGLSKENLNLRLEAQSLTIEGSLSLDLPPELESRYAEVRHQHYERTFALSRDLDGEKATAELANGVLTIRIPKTAEAAPRKIPVNVAAQGA